MSGYAPGTTHVSFGIEQRAGGHLFQLTFANNQGTTLANVARGGPSGNNWYLGFNLAQEVLLERRQAVIVHEQIETSIGTELH
ncbi:MAG: DUF5777 family beta-barrel protein [Sphingobacterium sp.]|nr:DUF5777 family beta-barrel protein [Sphingobacterium sp.]